MQARSECDHVAATAAMAEGKKPPEGCSWNLIPDAVEKAMEGSPDKAKCEVISALASRNNGWGRDGKAALGKDDVEAAKRLFEGWGAGPVLPALWLFPHWKVRTRFCAHCFGCWQRQPTSALVAAQPGPAIKPCTPMLWGC